MPYFPTPLYGLHGRAMPAGGDSTVWAETLNSSPYQPGDPRSISGLQLYTDAYSLQGSLGYLDAVASWPDWSGLNRTVEQSVGGSQPRFLPWSAAEGNYLALPGVASNYASTPDSAAVSITGDIDLRRRAALVSWTPATTAALLSKYLTTTDQRSYYLGIEAATGNILLILSSNGIVIDSNTSTVAPSVSANQAKWIRATFRASDGRVQFFTSDDNANWTKVGADVTSGISSIFDSTAPVNIGSINNGALLNEVGRAFEAEIRNGIDGPVVARFDPNRANANSSTFVADTGETWTINRTAIANAAQIVSAPAVMFDGTDDFMSVTDGLGMLRNVPGATVIATQRPSIITGPRFILSTAIGGISASSRLSMYIDSGERQLGGRRLDADTFASISAGAPTAHNYELRGQRVRYSDALARHYINGAAAAADAAFQTAGSTSNTDSSQIGIGCIGPASAPTQFHAGTISNVLVYNRALTDAEIRAASRYLARRARAGITVA